MKTIIIDLRLLITAGVFTLTFTVLSAQNPKTVNFFKLHCIEETDEVGSDEPYLLVTAVNLQALVPQIETSLYGPYGDTDAGETKYNLLFKGGIPKMPFTPKVPPFWPIDGKPATLLPGNMVIVVTMMENDDGSPSAARQAVKMAAVASIASSNGLPKNQRIQKLVNDINSAVKLPTGAPNFDDFVGSKVLIFNRTDYSLKESSLKRLYFNGDGGRYYADFSLTPAVNY